MKASEFKHWIIRPVLESMGKVKPVFNSPSAHALLIGTWAYESDGGTWVDQRVLRPGPAFGPLQMEPIAFDRVTEWLKHPRNADIKAVVDKWMLPGEPQITDLHGNFFHAVAYGRLYYWLDPHPLPEPQDIQGLAHYWKRVWNTSAGRGTVGEFINKWHLYVD